MNFRKIGMVIFLNGIKILINTLKDRRFWAAYLKEAEERWT